MSPGSPGKRPPPRVPFPTAQTHRRGANAFPAVRAEVGKKKKADDHSPAREPSTVVAQDTPYVVACQHRSAVCGLTAGPCGWKAMITSATRIARKFLGKMAPSWTARYAS